MPGGIFLVFVAVAVVVVLSLIHGHKREKERQAKLGAWANASGLSFSVTRLRDFDDVFPLPCFRKGENRYAYNLSRGERNGYSIVAGDYHYEIETRDSKGNRSTTTHRFSFALFQTAYPLRKLAIRKEGIMDKVTAAFGFDDIDFESAEFSKAFHIKCEDRKWAYDVIHPRTMELLLRNRDLRVEADANHLAVSTSRRWQIPQFEHHANTAIDFLDGVPDHAKGLG